MGSEDGLCSVCGEPLKTFNLAECSVVRCPEGCQDGELTKRYGLDFSEVSLLAGQEAVPACGG